ncbi:hypothetical protein V8C35DRAFT_279764 [Trichoderma chlorosporum]
MAASEKYWYCKFSTACKDGLDFPANPPPDAGLFIGALMDVYPSGEESLPKDWKKFAQKHPALADSLRMAASHFQPADEAPFRLCMQHYSIPVVKTRMMLDQQLHQHNIGLAANGDLPSVNRTGNGQMLVILGSNINETPTDTSVFDTNPAVQNQADIVDENPAIEASPIVAPSSTKYVRTIPTTKEYVKMVRQWRKGKGSMDEIMARIIAKSDAKKGQTSGEKERRKREKCEKREKKELRKREKREKREKNSQ